LQAIQESGALEYTQKMAENEALLAKNALAFLPDSPSKTSLLALADYAVARNI
jgi:octaprenyl-diphosphate synthase